MPFIVSGGVPLVCHQLAACGVRVHAVARCTSSSVDTTQARTPSADRRRRSAKPSSSGSRPGRDLRVQRFHSRFALRAPARVHGDELSQKHDDLGARGTQAGEHRTVRVQDRRRRDVVPNVIGSKVHQHHVGLVGRGPLRELARMFAGADQVGDQVAAEAFGLTFGAPLQLGCLGWCRRMKNCCAPCPSISLDNSCGPHVVPVIESPRGVMRQAAICALPAAPALPPAVPALPDAAAAAAGGRTARARRIRASHRAPPGALPPAAPAGRRRPRAHRLGSCWLRPPRRS